MRKTHTLRSVLIGSLMASAASVPAYAQIEEIIITAEKREASLQDTAISISAFDDELMDDIGIDGAGDIANYTPGMTYSGSPNRIYVRGVGRQTNELGSEPGVAIYRDGIYTNEAAAVSASSFVIDRIEVLRGPQGTLYGRNAIGGAAAVHSKRPTDEFEGSARATVGNNNYTSVGLMLRGPLRDNFRVLAAYANYEGGAYMKNMSGDDMNGAGDFATEVQFDWDISDRLNWWGRFEYYETDTTATAGITFDDYNKTMPVAVTANCAWYGTGWDAAATAIPGEVAFPGCDFDLNDLQQLAPNSQYGLTEDRPQLTDEYLVDLDNAGYRYTVGHRFTSHVSYDTEKWQFKYIAGMNTYDWSYNSDYDGTSRADLRYDEDIEQNESYSQHELQAISDLGGSIEFIFGAFYWQTENEQPYTLRSPTNDVLKTPYHWGYTGLGLAIDGFPVGSTNMFDADPNPDGIFYHQNAMLKNESIAVYGQADFFVNEQIHIAAGLRYSKDEKEGTEQQYMVFDGQGTYAGGVYSQFNPTNWALTAGGVQPARMAIDVNGGLISRDLSEEWDAMTWSLGIDYRPDDDTMYWAKGSTGFKAGGFKMGSFSAEPYVGEETLIAYEAGIKKTINDVFQINASAYLYDYQDQQVPVTAVINGVNHTLFLNAEDSEQFGFEADAQWYINENWTLMSTYTYMDATIGDMGEDVVDGGDVCTVTDQPTIDAWDIQALIDACGPMDGVAWNLAGNSLVKSPKNKFTLNSLHTWGVGDDGEMTFVVSYVHMDDQFASIFNRADTTIPSFDRLDFRLIYERPDDGVRITGYVRNATDELIVENMGRSAWRWNNAHWASSIQPPRSYGITVDIDF